jgi:hypothetical protein
MATSELVSSDLAPVLYPTDGEPDLVPGTRISVQSLPPPLNGRCGKVIEYDRLTQAYVVHVDGGNPRTIYRENLRILDDQSVPVIPQRRAPARPTRHVTQVTRQVSSLVSVQKMEIDQTSLAHHTIRPGDQVLLCLEQHQFTLLEVTGLRRVCKTEPYSFAIAASLDDVDIPQWLRKPPPSGSRRGPGGKPQLTAFRVGDPIYGVWPLDGRWYPGRVREDLGDRFEIEWIDNEAGTSVVKKSLVCRRTGFDDLPNRSSFLGALNVASRGLAGAPVDEEDEERLKEEESDRKAAAAASQLFGDDGSAPGTLTPEEWDTVVRSMKILGRVGIDGLVSSGRSEVFYCPPNFPQPATTPEDTPAPQPNWDADACGNLLAWLSDSPMETGGSSSHPSLAALEAAISRSHKKTVELPTGPLKFFQNE